MRKVIFLIIVLTIPMISISQHRQVLSIDMSSFPKNRNYIIDSVVFFGQKLKLINDTNLQNTYEYLLPKISSFAFQSNDTLGPSNSIGVFVNGRCLSIGPVVFFFRWGCTYDYLSFSFYKNKFYRKKMLFADLRNCKTAKFSGPVRNSFYENSDLYTYRLVMKVGWKGKRTK